MNDKQDVIVIGSGIGGLTTAAHLAKAGVKVLVFEQHSQPGGYFTSFKAKGYTFDGGIQACEDGGMFLATLGQLGILEKVRPVKSRFALCLPDVFVELQKIEDLNRFYDQLIQAFPNEAAGLNHVRTDALEFCYVMEAMWRFPNPLFNSLTGTIAGFPGWMKHHGRNAKGIGRFMELFQIPIDEYLKRYIKDQRLINFLSMMGYRGCPASFSMPFIFCLTDYYYPSRGGMQAVSDAMAEFILEKGGQIRYNSPVEQILTAGGHAVGVRTRAGEIFTARYVVNNGDAVRTYRDMLPHHAVPAAFRHKIESSRLSESVFLTYLGVDIPPAELPVRGCPHVIVMPDYDAPDQDAIENDPDYFSKSLLMVSAPSLHDPSLAPAGKSVIVLQSGAHIRFGDNWGIKNGKRTAGYRELKERVAAQLIANAERLIPGLSRKIEMKITASPHTHVRYTLNSDGATVGWSYHPHYTPYPGLKGLLGAGMFTPVKNLYQVGHWAMYPGGAPSGLMTGRMASLLIRSRMMLRK